MATKVAESNWRESRWLRYGELLSNEIGQQFSHGDFSVADVADRCDCIAHLSDRNRYDIAIAICREMEERGHLLRNARLYYFPTRKRRAA
jgi:hypothetical protein